MNFVELLEKTSNKLTHTEMVQETVNTTDNSKSGFDLQQSVH